MPETGERFEFAAPVVAAPAFAIRKPAVAVFTLDDYLHRCRHHELGPGRLSEVQSRLTKNILVAGGTISGKTTLTNALLAEVAKTTDRVVLIEDASCSARRRISWRSAPRTA